MGIYHLTSRCTQCFLEIHPYLYTVRHIRYISILVIMSIYFYTPGTGNLFEKEMTSCLNNAKDSSLCSE